MAGNIRSGAASQRLTEACIAFYGPECWLQLPGCTRWATTKDHVVPVDHGGSDAMENLRPACSACNSQRRNLAISGIGGILVTMVVGPPSTALTDHVLGQARAGDIIVDLQRIREALTVPGTTMPAAYLDKVAARAWRTASDQALRLSARCGVWIVHPVPTAKQLQQYARLRYRVETIDPGRAEAERIATETGDKQLMRETARWYQHYPEGAVSIERVKAHRPTTALARASPAADEPQPSRRW